MKRILALTLAALCALLLATSCDMFSIPGRMEALAATVEKNGSSYSQDQWDKANQKFEKIYQEYDALGVFEDIRGVSALEGTHVEELIESVSAFMEEGPMFFPEDMVTEDPVRFIASEIIREKILLYMEDEIPHGVAVEIEQFREEEDITRISACIYCERKTHKGMIIGKGGRKLKGIGKSAREELEALLGTKVYLQTWVKVRENWRDSDFALSNFGYKEDGR